MAQQPIPCNYLAVPLAVLPLAVILDLERTRFKLATAVPQPAKHLPLVGAPVCPGKHAATCEGVVSEVPCVPEGRKGKQNRFSTAEGLKSQHTVLHTCATFAECMQQYGCRGCLVSQHTKTCRRETDTPRRRTNTNHPDKTLTRAPRPTTMKTL